MYAILETLIDALRLMTFQPPARRRRCGGSDPAAAADQGMSNTSSPGNTARRHCCQAQG